MLLNFVRYLPREFGASINMTRTIVLGQGRGSDSAYEVNISNRWPRPPARSTRSGSQALGCGEAVDQKPKRGWAVNQDDVVVVGNTPIASLSFVSWLKAGTSSISGPSEIEACWSDIELFD